MLVYIGAVMVLFLFGIMLTRAQIGAESNLNNKNWAIGIPVALLLLGVLVVGGSSTSTATTSARAPDGPMPTQAIADNVLSQYLVPFLALSFILLAAAIGAIVLARKD